MLQAFLQRIVNGGGRIERQYGLGRKRTDLLIIWPQGERTRKFVVECKVLHKSLEHIIRAGLEQTADYMDLCAEAGHLIIFDLGEGRWEDKIFLRHESTGTVEIEVWGDVTSVTALGRIEELPVIMGIWWHEDDY